MSDKLVPGLEVAIWEGLVKRVQGLGLRGVVGMKGLHPKPETLHPKP